MAYMSDTENENLHDDDDIVEFEYNADGEEDLKATLKKLRAKLRNVEKDKQEYLTSWQRERADFLNYKKSENERLGHANDMARERFTEELLPVLDAYDLAFANKEAWEKVEKNWRLGVEYIHQQLLKVLSENGIEEIAVAVGDKIDPTMHEAIDTVATDHVVQDHTVAEIIQKGYKNGERIFRPARVKTFAIKIE